jgi:hypothetical protein
MFMSEKVSYIIKSLRAVLRPYRLRSIYFEYYQSHLRYAMIFWVGNSGSKMTFRVLKRAI